MVNLVNIEMNIERAGEVRLLIQGKGSSYVTKYKGDARTIGRVLVFAQYRSALVYIYRGRCSGRRDLRHRRARQARAARVRRSNFCGLPRLPAKIPIRYWRVGSDGMDHVRHARRRRAADAPLLTGSSISENLFNRSRAPASIVLNLVSLRCHLGGANHAVNLQLLTAATLATR